MLRTPTFAISLLASAGYAHAQTTLPVVEVTGVQIASTVICNGQCSNLFPAVLAELPGQTDEISSVGSTTLTGVCSGDAGDRETAVWQGYRQYLEETHGNGIYGLILQGLADEENRGQILTVTFSDGSAGTYLRTDTELGASHGFTEMTAPACGSEP